MNKVLFIGGDARSRYAFELLKKKGFEASSYGLFEGDGCLNLAQNYDSVILPIPTTRDNIFVNCPLTDTKIPLTRIAELYSDSLILSGGFCFEGLNCINYLNEPDFCMLNAVPTAEGAIAKAIELSPSTLWGSKILVIGYGKCGKILADRLLGLKCDVTVSARKAMDFATLDALNIKKIHTDSVDLKSPDFDIIFNTIDLDIITPRKELEKVLVIDISTKGCLDFSVAKDLGINAVKLPGIPGKSAPETAGKILAETVIKILNEENGKWKI